jgi:hypothetical protein
VLFMFNALGMHHVDAKQLGEVSSNTSKMIIPLYTPASRDVIFRDPGDQVM